MRNYLTSGKRLLVAEAKRTGPDFDLNGWMQAFASWSSFQQARQSTTSPGLSKEEVCFCAKSPKAQSLLGFRVQGLGLRPKAQTPNPKILNLKPKLLSLSPKPKPGQIS